MENKKLIRVYLSMSSKNKGGGSNSFVVNFKNWIKKNRMKYKLVKDIRKADKAIIIANRGDINRINEAKKNNCFIIHRLDEFFEKNESTVRKKKHEQLREINKYADITVFQSDFVYKNVQPNIKSKKYKIIINGGDTEYFYPGKKIGEYIGHVSWSYDKRKHYDYILEFIKKYPNEKFLLIGNHLMTEFPFKNFRNVKIIGAVNRKQIAKYYRKMKMLVLPSENDPCPNTAVEAILSGVPVCYNKRGGTKEIVKDCGLPLDRFDQFLKNCKKYADK